MTNKELSALIRKAMLEPNEDKAQALIAQANTELAKRGQLYSTESTS